MIDELQALEDWAGGMLAKLAPAERRAVLLDVGRELRRSQQKRITAQRNPDGSQFEPRKARAPSKNLRSKKGRIKQRAMFSKMKTARFLKVETDPDGLAIGFAGRIARIARIHQDGETGEVSPGINYNYPVRKILGFTEGDIDFIRDRLLQHLVK